MKISKSGFWETNGTHHFDESLAAALLQLFQSRGVVSLSDLGCGDGSYTKFFRDTIPCEGVDGCPLTKKNAGDEFHIADLSASYELKADWVLSLEVGEHLPKKYETGFIENVVNNCERGVVLSWAIPGQGGNGHFNEQSNSYVIDRLCGYGLKYDEDAAKGLRKASTLSWFKNTIMVFTK